MSFRLFIYYCALVGAWAALFGWTLGRFLGQGLDDQPVIKAAVSGMMLGLFVSLGLGLLDALWNIPFRRLHLIVVRVAVAVVVGLIGGMMGGMIGGFLYDRMPLSVFVIFGWSLTGFLIGASVGAFDVLSRVIQQEDPMGAVKKIVNGVIGGTVGGLLGGFLSIVLHGIWNRLFEGKPVDQLWSPSATGFVALGMCIGLLIGLAQVILREAWVKVQNGRRQGLELIITKPAIDIGRAEACDIGLFGYQGVEKNHARIVRKGNRFYLEDLDSPDGTYLNGDLIDGLTRLHSGDIIRVGNAKIRFGERKKNDAE
ncbi:MAG: FHA domain-containing protein [Gemmataceae bacterium]